MLLDALTVSLALLLSADFTRASPALRRSPASPSRGLHIPLLRRAAPQRNEAELGIWAKQQKQLLETKYGRPSARSEKRSSGYNLLVNQDLDSSYYGSIAVGTPAVAYDVILDSGSADLWLVDSQCSEGCNGLQAFDSSSSSTFTNESKPFAVTYGSGQAGGYLGQDVVQLAGFEVQHQVFGVCDQVSSGLLNAPVSGLMGVGWQELASSGAKPFWQALYEDNVLDEPLMAFYLTRFQNVSKAQTKEPGGVFTLGTTNSSLYTGDIDYQSIPSGAVAYWTLPITNMTVNSNSISLPSGQSSYAAIDTGTTLIGGPASQVSSVYAAIPNSAPGTGNYEGYYIYPCSTNVDISLSFGGKTWAIAPDDFKLTEISNGQCLGAIFAYSTSSNVGGENNNTPQWIVGDTFLKNVYTVFRANPASVGFAALAADAQSSVAEGGVPTPTIGSASVSVTGGSSSRNAAPPSAIPNHLVSLLFVMSTCLFYLL